MTQAISIPTTAETKTPQIVDSGTAVAVAQNAARRYDRWENAVNKFGGANDPMSVTIFQPGFRLSRQELDNIYEFDWISAKVVDIPAQDATRNWITLHHDSDPEKAEAAKKEMERWNLQALVAEAETLARLYGGSLLVTGAFDGGAPEEEVKVENIRHVNFIHPVDRFMAFPQEHFRDQNEQRFGEPETYIIHRTRVIGVEQLTTHSSRVVRFDGRYVPPVRRLRNFGWQNPVLTRLYEVIRQFGVSVQSGSSVLQDFVVKKMKIANLQDLIAGGQWEVITSRLALVAREISVNNLAVYGDDEDFEKMGTPVTGLHKLLELFIDYVSAAADIPRSRLFQNMTGSLGGDPGKNDLRVHYDNISAMQENKLRRPVQQLLDIILAPLGFKPGEITFTWNPLWQMSDTEQADIELKTAQKDQIYMGAGVVEPEEVALSRFSGDTVDLRNMEIDVERRVKALKDLEKIDLVAPEPEFDEEGGELGNRAAGSQNGPPQNGNGANGGRRAADNRQDSPSNVTNKSGANPHRHTFEIDDNGNGQTIDVIDQQFEIKDNHVHMIRTWGPVAGGEDDHLHELTSIAKITSTEN